MKHHPKPEPPIPEIPDSQLYSPAGCALHTREACPLVWYSFAENRWVCGMVRPDTRPDELQPKIHVERTRRISCGGPPDNQATVAA